MNEKQAGVLRNTIVLTENVAKLVFTFTHPISDE